MFQIEKMEETQILCTQMLVESDPEGEEEVEERQIGWLEVEGSKYRINQGENKIGRDLSCSIVLPKPSLSRIHAIIEVLNHRLIKITDGTLDAVYSRFLSISFTITLMQKPKELRVVRLSRCSLNGPTNLT